MDNNFATLLVTPLLLLSSLDCTEGRDDDVFGSVGFRAQSNRGKKVSVKMGRAEQVFCSIRTRPDKMVLMFKLLHGNSTLEELADCSEVRIEDHGDEKGIEKIHILGSHTRVLTVAVLVGSTFRQFANTSQDDDKKEPQQQGLSIDVFKAAVAVLPSRFTYKLVPFYLSCDQLLKEVAGKAFDAVLGGIVITAERSHLVEFSQPYAKLGLVMVVKKKNNELKDILRFMSPFTREMWVIMAAMTVLTGFVIRVIEHRTCNEMHSRHVEAVVCLPLAFLLNEHRPRNKLSFFVLVPWLILTLIVSTAFTASLSSMVTSSQGDEPSHSNVDSLRKTNDAIASDGNSFTVTYLVKCLGFKRKNIRKIASFDDRARALSSGNIQAAFLLTLDANVFLARYCYAFA
ncbi:glutamate receptor 2.8-like [Herrania umbratica]|uniref:Glutamate receptor 2.8-like n=1 Tax=Herrania umbratica TaxID=108875 RepID=A0A6J0ZLQ5_9ROSI|nr:glutamate receptor 2.8-like [Herrania umbratica]